MQHDPDRMPRGALVTGAGRRVGRAITQALAEDGWEVCVHYHSSAEDAEQTARDIRDKGGRATTVQADLSDTQACEELVAQATAAVGELGLLVNNASRFRFDDINSVTAEEWDRHMDANLRAPVLLSRDFAKALPEEACGCIVNMVDHKLWSLNPDFLSYTISKVGLHGLTEALAVALAPKVRVCGIAPGLLLPSTKMSDKTFERAHKATPLERGPEVRDIVATLRYILAVPSLTGETMVVDGGERLTPRSRDVIFDSRAGKKQV